MTETNRRPQQTNGNAGQSASADPGQWEANYWASLTAEERAAERWKTANDTDD